MARYIDADKIIEFITKGLNDPDNTKAFGYDAIEILTEIEYAPTADVVPKSEVERLEKENEILTINMNAYGLVAKRLAEEKSEVAREIFTDIERVLCFSIYPQIRADGTIKTIKSKDLTVRFEDYETIKKKYTEGE